MSFLSSPASSDVSSNSTLSFATSQASSLQIKPYPEEIRNIRISSARFCNEQVWILSQILPTLVCWRFRVHYSGFFAIVDFPITKNTISASCNDRGVTPTSRAQHSAAEILAEIVDDIAKVDIPVMTKVLLSKKKVDVSKKRMLVKDIKSVSKLTGVSIRQLWRAIQLYSKYIDFQTAFPSLQHNQQQRQNDVEQTYQQPPRWQDQAMIKLSITIYGVKMEHSKLAQTILGDIQDINRDRIFEVGRLPQDTARRAAESMMYLEAVAKCHRRYFSSLKFLPVLTWTQNLKYRDGDDPQQPATRTISFGGLVTDEGLGTDVWSLPPPRFENFNHKSHSQIASGRWRVKYRVNASVLQDKLIKDCCVLTKSETPDRISTCEGQDILIRLAEEYKQSRQHCAHNHSPRCHCRDRSRDNNNGHKRDIARKIDTNIVQTKFQPTYKTHVLESVTKHARSPSITSAAAIEKGQPGKKSRVKTVKSPNIPDNFPSPLKSSPSSSPLTTVVRTRDVSRYYTQRKLRQVTKYNESIGLKTAALETILEEEEED